MRCYGFVVFVHLVGYVTTAAKQTVNATEACTDFAPEGHPDSSWTYDDCRAVWDTYARGIPQGMQRRFPSIDLWRDTATQLRRAGSPCIVSTPAIRDGVGSSTLRHLATWIYAEQMGCDWAMPVWGRGFKMEGEEESAVYCHSLKFKQFDDKAEGAMMNHCSVTNWLEYFQFGVAAVVMPQNETFKVVEVGQFLIDLTGCERI